MLRIPRSYNKGEYSSYLLTSSSHSIDLLTSTTLLPKVPAATTLLHITFTNLLLTYSGTARYLMQSLISEITHPTTNPQIPNSSKAPSLKRRLVYKSSSPSAESVCLRAGNLKAVDDCEVFSTLHVRYRRILLPSTIPLW